MSRHYTIMVEIKRRQKFVSLAKALVALLEAMGETRRRICVGSGETKHILGHGRFEAPASYSHVAV